MKKIVGLFFLIVCFATTIYAVDHSGSISSDEMWYSISPHYITGNLTVSNGVTLTIQAGTLVKFSGNYYLKVYGKLVASGTSGSHITFTSNQGSPSAGYWLNLDFSSSNSGCSFSYCDIFYGGSLNGTIYGNDSGSNVSFSNCSIQYSGTNGFHLLYDSPTISNCTINNNTGYGIYCNASSADPLISDCTIQNNGNYAIRTHADNVKNITGNMTISGNTKNSIYVVSGHINTCTWNYHGVPYIIGGNMTIDNARTLTLDAGNTLKFNGDYYLQVSGKLVANGTSGNHITFTSNQGSPSAGDWQYIFFNYADNGCSLNYCDILYGGSLVDRGMIYIDESGSNVSFNNCNIEHSKCPGVFLWANSDPSFINCVIRNNDSYGIKIYGNSSHPTFGSNLSEWNDIYDNNGGEVGRSFRNSVTNNTAEYIYWGTVVESEINALIYDLGTLDFNPWVNSSHDNTLPVVLSSFTAQYLNNIPTLYWTTQSETDNIGWYVYRNEEENFTGADKISELIEGHGTTSQQQSYIYEDRIQNPEVGDKYYYWLESIDYSGIVNYYDRVAVLTIPFHDDPGSGSVTIPEQYGLLQNEPNPFISSTNISFNLPSTAHVDLAVYNINGQLVKILYSGVASTRTVQWDGKDEFGKAQKNGIYLYKLEVNGKLHEMKQMILLR